MTKRELYLALVQLCLDYGTTTIETYDALGNAVDSIVPDYGADEG